MNNIENMDVKKVFDSYPSEIRRKLLTLRLLILQTANEAETDEDIEETLKWGEPSYIISSGSTIRLGIPKSTSDTFAVYFNCKTRLIETFKELYREQFRYQDNRAIVFNLNDELPVNALKHCFSLALNYHRIKHLPLLGA